MINIFSELTKNIWKNQPILFDCFFVHLPMQTILIFRCLKEYQL